MSGSGAKVSLPTSTETEIVLLDGQFSSSQVLVWLTRPGTFAVTVTTRNSGAFTSHVAVEVSLQEKVLKFSADRVSGGVFYFNAIDSCDVTIRTKSGMLTQAPTFRLDLLYCGVPAQRLPAFERQAVNLLSIDGGGTLGLVPLLVLSRLQSLIREDLKDPEVDILDAFDYVCGTSAGGVIALALCHGVSLDNILANWADWSASIFKGKRTLLSGVLFEGYSTQHIQRLLRRVLGHEVISSVVRPLLSVCSTDVSHTPFRPFLHRNYTLLDAPHEGTTESPMWLAGWATAAAPTYLRGPGLAEMRSMGLSCFSGRQLVDGALVANNPSLVALKECAALTGLSTAEFIHERLGCWLSLGTGAPEVTRTAGADESASSLMIILKSGQLLTEGQLTHRELLRHWVGSYPQVYFRFNPPGLSSVNLDCVAQFDRVRQATGDYLMDEKHYDLQTLRRLLSPRLNKER